MKTRNLLMACACALFTLAGQAQTQVIAHLRGEKRCVSKFGRSENI